LEVLASTRRQEKVLKSIQVEVKETKLFADEITMCMENPKDSTKKTSRTNKSGH
jgi:hypothetical protein